MKVYYAISFKHACGTVGFYSEFSSEINFGTISDAKKHLLFVNKANNTDKYFLRIFCQFEDIESETIWSDED